MQSIEQSSAKPNCPHPLPALPANVQACRGATDRTCSFRRCSCRALFRRHEDLKIEYTRHFLGRAVTDGFAVIGNFCSNCLTSGIQQLPCPPLCFTEAASAAIRHPTEYRDHWQLAEPGQ